MGLLSRADLEKLRERLPEKEIQVDGCGSVRMVGVREGERQSILVLSSNEDGTDKHGQDSFRCRLVAQCLRNSDGTRMYEDTREDREALVNLPCNVFDALYEAARDLSGLGKKQTLETEIKNSETTGTGDSSSA